MKIFRKGYNLKIVFIVTMALLLFTNMLCSSSFAEYNLRPPVGRDEVSEDMKEVMNLEARKKATPYFSPDRESSLIAMPNYLESVRSILVKDEVVISMILKKLYSNKKETNRSMELKYSLSSDAPYGEKLEMIKLAEYYAIILDLFSEEEARTEFYERLSEIVSRKSFDGSMLEKDLETFALLYILQRNYFSYRQDLNPVANTELKLTRDIVIQLIRDLCNPFYERKGFFVCDFFSGRGATLLPGSEIKNLGYKSGDQMYVFGIESVDLPWSKVSTKGLTGAIRGDIFALKIPKSSVDVVTMFNPHSFKEFENVNKTVDAAKNILNPGGWVYIAVHAKDLRNHSHKEYAKWFLEAVESRGFSNIEEIPYPDDFPVPLWGKPASLIKAQKPSEPSPFRIKLAPLALKLKNALYRNL